MFTTIKNEVTAEIVEKKSKFIANIYYVQTKEEAENKIKDVKKQYYDARHNCSSYRIIEDGKIVEKASDDGEPSGTAGGPILNILQKNNLCNVVVIVTRYFGGILLGTGGLVRAYSEATIKALEEVEKVEFTEGKEFEVKLDYSNMENFKYYAKKKDINITKIEYSNHIICNIEVKNEEIQNFLEDIEKRKINIIEIKEICEKYLKI